ncbi:MAG TPA: tRNA (adenosine(37)-N6)-threonylcarbamoyltransferase complex ATPase subunit type 1 TsaE [Candidatus Atribacteria bacterium]|nr:tRNA (adenosine(37)-N6)-threonylcarbamoyltransferase complex ATPase subunit type 1 TsaE [Candidatus Atribacteria bacterium]
MNLTIITKSPEETKKIGKKVGKLAKPGDLIAFYGELGAGKTCFIQGISQGLKVQEYVTSPSFNIINEYKGKIPIFHFDFYRIDKEEEILGLNYEEYFYGEGLTVVEWSEKVEQFLPQEHLKIDIKFKDRSQRLISFEPRGGRFNNFIEELNRSENIRD